MSDFAQGVTITTLGMGLVFASLGLLMLIISGLQWLLRERSGAAPPATRRPVALMPALATAGAAQAGGVPAEAVESGHGPDEVPGEIVAAVVVALAVLKRRQTACPPPETTVVTFTPGSSAWRALGRLP